MQEFAYFIEPKLYDCLRRTYLRSYSKQPQPSTHIKNHLNKIHLNTSPVVRSDK